LSFHENIIFVEYSYILKLKDKTMSAAREHGCGPNQVVHVARSQREGVGPAVMIRQRVNLGHPPAARTADGVVEGPPLAPAAERLP